jgi:hypothetical protein
MKAAYMFLAFSKQFVSSNVAYTKVFVAYTKVFYSSEFRGSKSFR